jgi:hypothetical protein
MYDFPKLSPDGTMLAMIFDRALGAGEIDDIATQVIDLETGELVLESGTGFGEFLWAPDSHALIRLGNEGLLEVLPINGDEAYLVELTGDFPRVIDWAFLRWETDTVFLVSVGYAHIGGEENDIGIWAVNVATGEVERRL